MKDLEGLHNMPSPIQLPKLNQEDKKSLIKPITGNGEKNKSKKQKKKNPSV